MPEKIVVIVLGILLYAAGSQKCSAQQDSANVSVPSIYGQIELQLSRFETNKTAAAATEIDLSLVSLANQRFDDRQAYARVWLEALTMVDNNLDTNFDERVPRFSWVVTPPPDGTNGYQYPAGIAPEALKDPVARSNYIIAISENTEKADECNLQTCLFKLNRDANWQFERFLKKSYMSSEVDKKEISQMINESKLSDAHKERFYRLLGIPAEGSPRKGVGQ